MKAPKKLRASITAQLMLLFALLLVAFTLIVSILFNALMRRQTIQHHSKTMQRNAYAISQNLSEVFAPTRYEDSLDETRFIVRDDMLAPYLAMTEQITRCNVYLVDTRHNITGYFDGVLQTLQNPLLPAYIEQTIALGFMGKTPFIQAEADGETHLTACMPVMNAQSRVLGGILLESTLTSLGYAQVPSAAILLTSLAISFGLSVLLALGFTRLFTHRIHRLKHVALALAGGAYDTRTHTDREDEIGSLANSMDILAERLEDARRRDEQLHSQQQAFFSNISHELKTPVTIIRASLEALHDGVIRGEDNIQDYYAQMLTESRWLQRLIADLLELSRLQNLDFSLNMEPVCMSELLGDVAMSAHTLCERKGVRFICEEPDAEWTIQGDYTRLRQMLLAVVDNAVKFTPAGKRVQLLLNSEVPSVTIVDEGVGIPQEDIPHIFDRFHHTHDASRESTGLGLAIVQEIASRHGIRIHVESQEGKGTTVAFLFPQTV